MKVERMDNMDRMDGMDKHGQSIVSILSISSILSILSVLMFAGGCKSMADPDKSPIPQAEKADWELVPGIPARMMDR